MSSSPDSEMRRAAHEKAREGRHLLNAGDYEGAIAACTEAIKSAPDFHGPYQTRAAAYGHLEMEKEAEADLQHLGGQQRPRNHADAPGRVIEGYPFWDAVLPLGFGLGLIVGGVWGITAPWVTDVTLWWPTTLGIIGLLFGLAVIEGEIKNPAGTVELAGTVTGMRAETSIWDDPARFYINVSRTEFEVTRSLYRGVSEGDEVVLTVRGFRWDTNLGSSNYKVMEIRRCTSSTGLQWFVPEHERRPYAPRWDPRIRVMGASESVWRSLSQQELPMEAVVDEVERLELSPRTLNCLKRAHLTKVGEILEMSDDELLKIRGFGNKSLSELREKLAEKGYWLPGAGNGPLPAPELTDEDLSRPQDEDEDDEEEEDF